MTAEGSRGPAARPGAAPAATDATPSLRPQPGTPAKTTPLYHGLGLRFLIMIRKAPMIEQKALFAGAKGIEAQVLR